MRFLVMTFWNVSHVSAYNFRLKYGIVKRLVARHRARLALPADIKLAFEVLRETSFFRRSQFLHICVVAILPYILYTVHNYTQKDFFTIKDLAIKSRKDGQVFGSYFHLCLVVPTSLAGLWTTVTHVCPSMRWLVDCLPHSGRTGSCTMELTPLTCQSNPTTSCWWKRCSILSTSSSSSQSPSGCLMFTTTMPVRYCWCTV